jgi:CPA1 family monovalent cation:H+ antiporter
VVSLFELLSALLAAIALLGWINRRWLDMPVGVWLVLGGLGVALAVKATALIWPGQGVARQVHEAIQGIDFHAAVMNGMLAFLLFASSLEIDLSALRSRRLVVAVTATAGVVVSTVIVGLGAWLVAQALGLPLTLPWALVLGVIVSPTDPVAVMAALAGVTLPQSLRTDIAGESLFNDGVAVVIFTVLLGVATGSFEPTVSTVTLFFVREVGGALALGALAGYLAYRAMRAVDDYPLEVMISLALACGAYALAQRLHMSGPLAVVAAGLVVGERGPMDAMSATTQAYLFGFWRLVDHLLNAVLFFLIGLELLVMPYERGLALFALAVVAVTLLARFVSVAGAVSALSRRIPFARGSIPILTWAGVRGGISIALALSISAEAERPPILAGVYAVVLFTLIVQGLTLERLARRYVWDAEPEPERRAGERPPTLQRH